MRTSFPALGLALSLAAGGWASAQDASGLFTKLDGDKDGFVTGDEVPEEQKQLYQRLLRNGDKNNDDKLSAEELSAALAPREGERPPLGGGEFPGRPGGGPNPREFFERLDANKDGSLSKDELPPFLQQAFTRLDSDNDGQLSGEELRQAPLGQLRRPDGPPERRPNGPRPDGPPEGRPDGAGRPGGPPDGPPRGGLFAALDTDRDGRLTTAEIVGAGTALLKLDRNGDGALTPDETFAGPGGPPGRRGEMRPGEMRPGERRPGEGPRGEGRPGEGRFGGQAFEAFRDRLKQADADNDGKLSKDEAPDRLKENFDRIDANSDGFIDEAEARQMFARMREGNPERTP